MANVVDSAAGWLVPTTRLPDIGLTDAVGSAGLPVAGSTGAAPVVGLLPDNGLTAAVGSTGAAPVAGAAAC